MTAADMPRFLIKAGSAGDWMVWDRAARGPAMLNDRKLNRLSREAAEAAFMKLLSPEGRVDDARQAGSWQVLYASQLVDCRDENEAKVLARTLLKKGMTVSARFINGDMVLWTVDGRDKMRGWLSK